MKILAIETSCDETAAAVVESAGKMVARAGLSVNGGELVERLLHAD